MLSCQNIENVYITPKKISMLLDEVEGISDIELRIFWKGASDIHLEFKYQGVDFIVWEPYGDNSRYWIGPKEKSEIIDISSIEEVFERYKPMLLTKILGDLVTLNFRSLFK